MNPVVFLLLIPFFSLGQIDQHGGFISENQKVKYETIISVDNIEQDLTEEQRERLNEVKKVLEKKLEEEAISESEDPWPSGAVLKIIGIFVTVLLVGIMKTVKDGKVNGQIERLNELLKRVPKSEFEIDEDELVDKFNISTYEGLFQDFRSYKADEHLIVELYRKSIGFSYKGCEASLKYNHIDKITLFTKGRGRYNANIDTYLKLDFNKETLVKTVRNEHYSEFLEQIGRIRIRKSNVRLKGELNNLDFERSIEQILKELGE